MTFQKHMLESSRNARIIARIIARIYLLVSSIFPPRSNIPSLIRAKRTVLLDGIIARIFFCETVVFNVFLVFRVLLVTGTVMTSCHTLVSSKWKPNNSRSCRYIVRLVVLCKHYERLIPCTCFTDNVTCTVHTTTNTTQRPCD